MATCEPELLKAIRAIEPTAHQKAGAKRSHNFLRDMLGMGNFKDRILDSYLSGSYARDTAIAPLDDVDIIFLIDSTHWDNGSLFYSKPQPDDLLKSFARAIRYRYKNSSVRLQRRSVCLQLNHIHLDVVPALEVANGGTLIEIPDREADCWIRTNPRAHSDYSSRVNQMNAKRLKPAIKLLKFWNSMLPSTARMKSFAIETLATRLFEHEHISSMQEGLLRFFDFVLYLHHQPTHFRWQSRRNISLKYPLKLLDASGISNLLAHADSTRVERFVAQATRSRDLFLQADKLVRVDAAWRRVASALRYPV